MQFNKPKISVAITSYNGEKYILEQLASIKNQTMAPDEVIIRDDRSTDSTYQLIKNYIRENKLNTWKIIQNNSNIGWKVNFKLVLESTTGDIIFLSDQDDIWAKNKIEKMVNALIENPEIELLTSEYSILIDNHIIHAPSKKKLITMPKFDYKFFHNRRPGAVYAMKRILLDELKPIWKIEAPHDAQLWLIAMLRHTIRYYNEPLVLYRRHESTATGRDEFALKTKMKNIKYEELLLDIASIYNKQKRLLTDEEALILNKSIQYIKKRKRAMETKSILSTLCMFQYIKHYIKIRTWFGDVIVTFYK